MAGENDQTLPLAQIPDPAPQPQPQPAPVVTDLDEIELRDALKAVEAEKAAGGATPADPATGQVQPQPQPQPGPKEPSADSPMIPKARFDEVLTAQRTAEQNAAYWKGIADARAAPAPAQVQQQPQPAATPEQRLAQIDTAIDALAKKYDDGEITYADLKKEERALQTQATAIRTEAAPRQQQQSQPAPQQDGNELYLETLTAQLEESHPWVGVLDKVGTKADWDYVTAQAIERVVAAGKDPRNGALGKYELRKAAAEIADEIGPALLTKRAQAKGVTLPGQQSQPQPHPAQPAKPALSPEAQARKDALTRAQGHPPNLSAMTNAGGTDGSGVPSEAALERMSDEDIGNLPAAVRNKLLGIAA